MPDDPLPIGTIEWIDFKYRELEDDELFYMNTERDDFKNPPMRKANDTTALIIRENRTIPVEPTKKVYQKDY